MQMKMMRGRTTILSKERIEKGRWAHEWGKKRRTRHNI